jgi:6-phosphogluconolactonase
MIQGNREILSFNSTDDMVDFAIDKWSAISKKAIDEKGFFSVALSGGKSPVPFYEKLAETSGLLWGMTHVFMVDERFVPYDSYDNNHHLINRTLLMNIEIPAANIHPILTTEITPQASAAKYEEDLAAFFKKTKSGIPGFDLVIMGVGDDGHTASLFPGTSAIDEAKHLAVEGVSPDKALRERITITFPLINNSEHIIFLVTGTSKAGVTKDIVENEKSLLPAAKVMPRTGRTIFLLDREASSQLIH